MRTRVVLSIVVGLLFCTLATLEFPEFLRLVDDTSNDYSLTTEVREALPSIAQKEAPRRAALRAASAPRRDWGPTRFRFSHSPFAADILHWICILRT